MTQSPTPVIEPGSEPLKNEKQELFCIEYLKDHNATQAYIRAGYKASKSAGVNAHLLINKHDVKVRVDHLRRSKWRAAHMSAEEVLAEMGKIARFNVARITHITPQGEPYIDLSMATEDDMAAITELSISDVLEGRGDDVRNVRTVKAKAPNKLQALAHLAKHHGLLTDKLDITVTGDLVGKMAQARERMRRAREKKDD